MAFKDMPLDQMHTEVKVSYRLSELGYITHLDTDPDDLELAAEIDAEFELFIARVRAEALREAVAELESMSDGGRRGMHEHSKSAASAAALHLATIKLRARADRIEAGEA